MAPVSVRMHAKVKILFTQQKDRMSTSLISFLFLSAIAAAASGACPDGWIQFENDCLWFSSRAHSWVDAENDCRKRVSYMATDDSSGKHNFLKKFINIFDSWKLTHWWIGGSDFAVENQWRWVETGTNIGGYSAWDVGQPDGNSSANCMSIGFNADHNLVWRDDRCTRSYNYICEQAATGPSATMPTIVG